MGLAVDRLELGPIGTNTYLVRVSPTATEAVVVDPSGDAAEILGTLAAQTATCSAILVTHGHFDHIVSLADLASETGAPIYAPVAERILFEDPSMFTMPGITVKPSAPDRWLEGGETVAEAGLTFAVASVPGHSPGHLAYYAEGHLFSGDVLFAGSVGRTDLPSGDWNVLQASIAALLDAYSLDTVVHPGHGPETTLGAELHRNPFLADIRATRAAE